MLPVKVSRSNKATTHCSAEQKYLTNFFCNSENPQNMIKITRDCENLDEREVVAKRPKSLNICRGGGWKREVGRRSRHRRKEKGKMSKNGIPKTAKLGIFFSGSSHPPDFHILLQEMAWDGILRRFFAVRVDFEVFPSIFKYLPVFALKYFPTDCFPFIQLGASGQLSQMHNKDQKERRSMHLLMKILEN